MLQAGSASGVDRLEVLELAIACLDEGVTVHDADGAVVAVNAAMGEIVGRPREQLLGTNPRRSHPELLDAAGRPVAHPAVRVLETGADVARHTLTFQRPDRSRPRRVEATARAMRDGDGALQGVLVRIWDVTTEPLAELPAVADAVAGRLRDPTTMAWIKDAEGRYVYLSPALLAHLGRTADESLGLVDEDLHGPEVSRRLRAMHQRAVEERHLAVDHGQVLGPRGRRDFLAVAVPLFDEERVEAVAGLAVDLTGTADRREEHRSQRWFDVLPDGIVVFDQHDRLRAINRAAVRIFGTAALEEAALTHEDGRPLERLRDLPEAGEARLVLHRPPGDSRHLVAWRTVLPGTLGDWLLHVRDTSRDTSTIARLEREAFVDELTELPNRRLFDTLLEQALARAQRRGTGVAVFFGDLDSLKVVNDRHGHAAGDALIAAVGRRLRAALRRSDAAGRAGAVAGRRGGDEFLVLVEDLPVPAVDAAETVRRRVLEAVEQPVDLGGGLLWDVRMSLGAAYFPDDGETAAELVAEADAAMYRRKQGR
jgi:diguanylate cyclase (GGDEF)-like protein/PAS domain S-box-containing protein